jgi:hypothetical protein
MIRTPPSYRGARHYGSFLLIQASKQTLLMSPLPLLMLSPAPFLLG